MSRKWKDWFAAAWPNYAKRQAVLNDYASLAAHPLFLADLALRGNVYDDSNPPTDPVALGIYVGRRQLALETLKLANKTPQQLSAFLTAQEPSR